MKRLPLILIVLSVFFSCGEEKVPEGYLNHEEMAGILLDIYIAEGRMTYKNSPVSSMEVFPVYKDIIMERHGVTDSVYHQNLSYYITHPEQMDKVYEIVIDSLKLRRQALPGAPPI